MPAKIVRQKGGTKVIRLTRAGTHSDELVLRLHDDGSWNLQLNSDKMSAWEREDLTALLEALQKVV